MRLWSLSRWMGPPATTSDYTDTYGYIGDLAKLGGSHHARRRQGMDVTAINHPYGRSLKSSTPPQRVKSQMYREFLHIHLNVHHNIAHWLGALLTPLSITITPENWTSHLQQNTSAQWNWWQNNRGNADSRKKQSCRNRWLPWWLPPAALNKEAQIIDIEFWLKMISDIRNNSQELQNTTQTTSAQMTGKQNSEHATVLTKHIPSTKARQQAIKADRHMRLAMCPKPQTSGPCSYSNKQAAAALEGIGKKEVILQWLLLKIPRKQGNVSAPHPIFKPTHAGAISRSDIPAEDDWT